MYKMIIFDFDGTIANTYTLLNKVYFELTKMYDFPSLTQQEIEDLRNLSSREILKAFNVPLWRLPRILKDALPIYRKFLPESPIYPDIKALLLALHKENFKLFILSSNNDLMIKQFLVEHDLDIFETIVGNVGLFKKHRALKKLIRKSKINKSDILYVGDEVRDIDACKKVGIDIAAVTWGYDHAEILTSKNPKFIIYDADILHRILLKK